MKEGINTWIIKCKYCGGMTDIKNSYIFGYNCSYCGNDISLQGMFELIRNKEEGSDEEISNSIKELMDLDEGDCFIYKEKIYRVFNHRNNCYCFDTNSVINTFNGYEEVKEVKIKLSVELK